MSDPPDLEAIRTAVRQQIEATSLRRTAAEIGFSASGLRRIAEGRGHVYRSSLQRLERWYAKQAGREQPPECDALDEATRAALASMVRSLIPAGIIESTEAPMEWAETPESAREREAELLRRFVSGTDSERAESFMAIYGRFRSAVREELERAGLAAQKAEERVGAVFGRTLAAGHSRTSPPPPMPLTERSPLRVLDDQPTGIGYVLWRVLEDVRLWEGSSEEERRALFHPPDPRAGESLRFALLDAPELQDAVQALWTAHVLPELARREVLGDACVRVTEWAEANSLKETALQFAELAARLQPDEPSRAFTAGRLARRLGEGQRAAIWYWRSIRLARRANSNIGRANAHLGLGNLAIERGAFREAEAHLWKAARASLRQGRKSLAAAAYHNLLVSAVYQEHWSAALEAASETVKLYPASHPRFPLAAHDVAFLWCRLGYYSSALPIFEAVLPWARNAREEILVLASLARSRAAVRDHIQYERLAARVLALAAVDQEMAASSLYHLAEGARCFHEWDRSRQLAERALRMANERTDATTIRNSERLLALLAKQTPGEVDVVPADGDVVDRTRELLITKLSKQPPPDDVYVPPERYPTD